MHHLFVHVDGLAITPRLERAFREGDHHLPVGGNPLSVKGGLGEPPLSPPEPALAGQETLTEQAPVSLEDSRLGEIAIILDEHVLDQVWIREQVQVLAHEAQPDYVTVLSSATGKEAQGVSRVLPQVVPDCLHAS
jgi:hypothetical protein